MKVKSATNARIHFDRVIEQALLEPILIEKSGRTIAVVLSFEEYQRVSNIEDKYWVDKAIQAKEEGFIGTQAGETFLQNLLKLKYKK